MGRPKALVHDPDGTSWLRRAVSALLDGGCAHLAVVLGAAPEAVDLLDPDPRVRMLACVDWSEGISASLRCGLDDLGAADARAALVSLVDLPDVGAPVVRRVLAAAGDDPASALARAVYDGRPGHPVLLGRDHWAAARTDAVGDQGARDLLAGPTVTRVECGDLAGGEDVDRR